MGSEDVSHFVQNRMTHVANKFYSNYRLFRLMPAGKIAENTYLDGEIENNKNKMKQMGYTARDLIKP